MKLDYSGSAGTSMDDAEVTGEIAAPMSFRKLPSSESKTITLIRLEKCMPRQNGRVRRHYAQAVLSARNDSVHLMSLGYGGGEDFRVAELAPIQARDLADELLFAANEVELALQAKEAGTLVMQARDETAR